MSPKIDQLTQFNKLYKFLKERLKTSSSTAGQEKSFLEAFKQERPLILKELFGPEYDQSTILQQAEGLDFDTIPDQTQREECKKLLLKTAKREQFREMLKDPKFFEKNKPYLVSMVEENEIQGIIEEFIKDGVKEKSFSYSLIVSGREEGGNMSPNLYQLNGSNIAICVDPDLVDINHAETVARATYGKIPEYQKHKSSTFAGKVTTSRPEVTMASGEEDRIADLSRWDPLDKKYEQDGNGDINQIAANLLYQHNVKGIRKYNELLVTAKKDLPSPVSGIVITDNNTFDDSEFNPDIIKGLLESHPNLKLYLYSPNTTNSMVECDREIAIAALSDVEDIKEADGTITFDQFKAKYAEVEKSRSATKSGQERHNPPSTSTSIRGNTSQLLPKESRGLGGASAA